MTACSPSGLPGLGWMVNVLDMLNGGANVHGGCSAFLIDMYANLFIITDTVL